jgi:RNA polymerase sigma factor (sigma-70 family)
MEEFITHQKEGAFAFLVRRHGPMVFNVCRRILASSHDTEDAFQATFLVLARRLKSISQKESIGGWLHCVARRIALRARAQAAARRNREQEAVAAMRPGDDLTSQEVRAVLDEEIALLPEKYSTPIVLCYLEGKSYERAARQIGCPKPSLASRLARARELLRRRLERRGITLLAATLTTALAEMGTAAPLPALLTIKTIKAAALVATGKSAVGCFSAGAVALEEAVTGMLGIKGKLLSTALVVGLAIGGAGWAGKGGVGKPAPAPQAAVAKEVADGPARKEPTVDQYGDPLPTGATARLGARRFRNEGETTTLAFGAHGKSLLGSSHSGILAWDAATGKETYRLIAPMPSYGMGVAFSRDGNTLAMPEYFPDEMETKVSLWDLRSGTKTRTLALPKAPKAEGDKIHFNDLCFSPDGKSLAASRTNEGKAIVLDLTSGKVRASLTSRGEQAFHRVVIAPDNKTLAAVVYSLDHTAVHPTNGIQIWDIDTEKLLRTIHPLLNRTFVDDVSSLVFSPDGTMLAFGDRTRVVVADPTTGKELMKVEPEQAPGHPIGLAFTPGGKKLASGWSMGSILVWDVPTGKELQNFTGRVLQGRVSTFTERCYYSGALALSPDGRTIALGTMGNTVQLWDLATGTELYTEYKGHDSQINDLAFSPDGKTLVSAGEFGQIYRWERNKWSGSLPYAGHAARTLTFSPTGKQLAAVETRAIRIWDIAEAKKPSIIDVADAMDVTAAIFSPDGRKLFTLDTDRENWSVRHWDAATGKQDQRWVIPAQRRPRYVKGQDKWAITLSPDGKTVVSARQDGDIGTYELASGRERLFPGQKELVTHVAVSHDGRLLAAGIERPTSVVKLWEVLSGKPTLLLKGHQGPVGKIAWSPDGRLLATGDQRRDEWQPTVSQTIRIWDTASGIELACFGDLHADVTAMIFSPDSRSLVAGLRDSTLLVFDVAEKNRNLVRAPGISRKTLESLWADLISADAGKAHQALGTLAAGPQDSVPFLLDRLRPAVNPDMPKIQRWIADLDSDQFALRQKAARELEKLGWRSQAPIQNALRSNLTLETRRRLEQILRTLPGEPTADTLRTIRAIMVLERIGSPDAQAVLATLAAGAPGARETEEAKASLERLKVRATTAH